MEQYVGLDVSLEETSVCVLDAAGKVGFRGAEPDIRVSRTLAVANRQRTRKKLRQNDNVA